MPFPDGQGKGFYLTLGTSLGWSCSPHPGHAPEGPMPPREVGDIHGTCVMLMPRTQVCPASDLWAHPWSIVALASTCPLVPDRAGSSEGVPPGVPLQLSS